MPAHQVGLPVRLQFPRGRGIVGEERKRADTHCWVPPSLVRSVTFLRGLVSRDRDTRRVDGLTGCGYATAEKDSFDGHATVLLSHG